MPDTTTRLRLAPLAANLGSSLFSRCGNAISAVALPLITLGDTGSPLAAGLVGVFSTVPLVIGGIFGGMLVDRFGYRRSSIAADLASAVTILAIPILWQTTGLPFWGLLTLVFLGGLLEPPGDSAKISMTPTLAGMAGVSLARAASAQSAIQRMSSMIGAALAGVFVAWLGPVAALYINGVTFVIAAVIVKYLIPHLKITVADESAPSGQVQYFMTGLRFILRTPLLVAIILLVTLTNALDAVGFTVLRPLYATEVLRDPATLGLMSSLFAGGALLGSIIFGAIGSRYSGRVMFAVAFVLAGAPPFIAMGQPIPFWLMGAILAFSGLMAGCLNPMISTAMYGLVPDGMRARVFGLTSAGAGAMMPVGALLGGLSAEHFGLIPTTLVCGALYLALGLTPLFSRSFRGLKVVEGG